MSKTNVSRNLRLVLAALAICFAAHASALAQSCPVNFNTTGSITAGDTTQTGHVTRNGVPSDCNGKVYPGTNDTTAGRHFDQYTFTNTNATAACIGVTFTGTIAGLHSVAYLNNYDPANIQTNYLGDLGVLYTANTTASYSFNVPAGATFVVVVHETTIPAPTNSYTLAVGCATAPPPLPTVGQILISEFRLSGPAAGAGSQRDEFIELYNNSDGPLTIDRLLLQAYDPNFNAPGDGADFVQGFPAGAVIPARGHYLVGDGGDYSLASYAALDMDTSTVFAGDFFIDNEGIQVVSNDGLTVFDSVGVSGSGGRPGEAVNYTEGTPIPRRTQTAPTVQYAYVRKMPTGLPQDTNNNANDFTLVSVTGTTFPLSAGGTTQSTLGAPGPESLASPVQRNATLKASLPDPAAGPNGAANRVRNTTSGGAGTPTAFGTLTLRRKFTNNSTNQVSQIRWRVVDITTLGGVSAGQADLRVISSPTADFTVTVTGGGTVPVKGTQVEQPPTQTIGGGLNSSIVTITPAIPIPPNGSVNIEFTLGVAAAGNYRFFVNTEAAFGALTVLAPGQRANKGLLAQKASSRANDQSGPRATPVKRDALRVLSTTPRRTQ